MENKSPFVLIGAAMLLFIAALAGFLVWKLRAGDQTAYAYYVILFSGDVQGLTKDSPVFYRGLRVGRVQHIGLTSRMGVQRSTGKPRLNEMIEVTVAIDSGVDIREQSYAVFEKPFIAGAAYIQIVGRYEVNKIKPKKKLGDKPYPEIREGASFFQQTSTSAQELLAKAGTTVERLNELLSPDNINSVSNTLKNLSTVTGALAKQDAALQATIAGLPKTIADVRKTFDKLNLIATELGPQDAGTRKALAGKESGELRKTIVEARTTLGNIDRAAKEIGDLLGNTKRPIEQFSQTGLTELALTIHELRQLTANLNIIATKLERDPAGFVFSGKQGYTPK